MGLGTVNGIGQNPVLCVRKGYNFASSCLVYFKGRNFALSFGPDIFSGQTISQCKAHQ